MFIEIRMPCGIWQKKGLGFRRIVAALLRKSGGTFLPPGGCFCGAGLAFSAVSIVDLSTDRAKKKGGRVVVMENSGNFAAKSGGTLRGPCEAFAAKYLSTERRYDMKITPLIAPFFKSRVRAIDRYATDSEALQSSAFHSLLRRARDTEWGRKYGYGEIRTYEEFCRRVPLQTYEELKGYVERVRQGEENILWPGRTKWFAKSSGTTNDKSKYLPVTADALRTIHYRGGQDCVALYLHKINPQSRFFDGKGLILGGSHSPNLNTPHSLVGDLSAILMENIPSLVNLIRVPSKKIALMDEWEAKIRVMAEAVIPENVTNLSGVPSWFLVLIKHILHETGKATLEEVWPNLEVFFHGGVAFTPYREQYRQVIHKEDMHYVETYNASEGFFGVQNDLSDPAMLLMVDYGMFYEFLPMDEFGSENPHTVPLSGVELGKNYALVLNNCCGLWRYLIGDTVRFTSKNPWKFIISGRTKHFINAFGEELMVDNAEKALARACAACGAMVTDYTAAPVFMDSRAKCRHQWLIEFAQMPDSVAHFAEVLDTSLKELNSDYEAKRWKDIALQMPEIIVARENLFHDWLAQKGKLGGQHKVPRLCNDRRYMDELCALNAQ
jgi:hypothetical protein